mmetsp:Transcript_6618/g.6197  ORF Transcript_6618/g.6197 Transcript_6618/m.6197 type:complete len:108 (+) Transcript_6618:581-904(+)
MGDAVVLPSGDLKFDKVIAAYCPDHDEEIGDERSIYFLKEAIERVLDLSSLYQFNSIMIPSFCTSKSKFPVDLYAKVVIKTVKDYIENYGNMQEKTITISYSNSKDK